MTAPATPLKPTTQTHPCARCGAPVALDAGLCEGCNPLGLKDSASSQVHGTVFVAVGMAVLGLAIAAHFAVAGIGPFTASVSSIRSGSTAEAVVATITIRNDGSAAGSASCRLTDPADRSFIGAAVVQSPRVQPGTTVTFDAELDFGAPGGALDVVCSGP